MEKTLSKTKTNFIVYLLIILFRCIVYVPEMTLGININNLDISFAPANIINFASLVLFSVVCAFVVSKLTSDGGVTIFIALLFFLDPIFKHSFLSLAHTVVLAVMALVIYCTVTTESAILKRLLVIVFSCAAVFVCPNAVWSCIPLTAYVCILSDCNLGKSAAVKKSKKSILLTVAFYVILIAVCVGAWMLNKNLTNVSNLIRSFDFATLSISLSYHLPRFLVANIPFIAITAVFFRNYLNVKASVRRYGFIVCFAIVYAAMIAGAFVFNCAESFTSINLLTVLTLAAIYRLDKENASAALGKITGWFKAHPYITISALAAWIMITQSLFQEMQQTIWSKIITTTGELV